MNYIERSTKLVLVFFTQNKTQKQPNVTAAHTKLTPKLHAKAKLTYAIPSLYYSCVCNETKLGQQMTPLKRRNVLGHVHR